jgi:hypothetical protein
MALSLVLKPSSAIDSTKIGALSHDEMLTVSESNRPDAKSRADKIKREAMNPYFPSRLL